MQKKIKIAIAGTGYVGLSLAVLLAQFNTVYAVDIDPAKIDMMHRRISPIADAGITEYLSTKDLDLTPTLNAEKAYSSADFVVIATPTDYDAGKDFFDTSAVEHVIHQVLQ